MDISAIKTNEEIRAQIVQQLRGALKLDPDAKIPATVANGGLEGLRAQILEKVRASANSSPFAAGSKSAEFSPGATTSTIYGFSPFAAGAKPAGVEVDVNDMRTRMLFYRIKNARMPKQQRDALSGFVRSMALDDKVDAKTIKSVSEMIFVLEMSSDFKKGREFSTFPAEKSVNDEMEQIYKQRSSRDDMRERLDSLSAQIA